MQPLPALPRAERGRVRVGARLAEDNNYRTKFTRSCNIWSEAVITRELAWKPR